MSAVSTANSYASAIPSLIGNPLSGPQASAANASQDRGPATFVDLSDRVKYTLSRAISDRATADRLRAFVEQHGLSGANGSAQDTSPSSDQDAASDVTQAFEQLSGGTSGIGSSVSVQSDENDNKAYITFSDSEVAATNVTASSTAGIISTTSVGTHTGAVTFVVDFTTGEISMEQAESTSVATSVQIGSNQSTFSTLA